MDLEEIREQLCVLSKLSGQLSKLNNYKNSPADRKYLEFDNNSSSVEDASAPSILIYESEASILFDKFINDMEKMYIDKINVEIASLLTKLNSQS